MRAVPASATDQYTKKNITTCTQIKYHINISHTHKFIIYIYIYNNNNFNPAVCKIVCL